MEWKNYASYITAKGRPSIKQRWMKKAWHNFPFAFRSRRKGKSGMSGARNKRGETVTTTRKLLIFSVTHDASDYSQFPTRSPDKCEILKENLLSSHRRCIDGGGKKSSNSWNFSHIIKNAVIRFLPILSCCDVTQNSSSNERERAKMENDNEFKAGVHNWLIHDNGKASVPKDVFNVLMARRVRVPSRG